MPLSPSPSASLLVIVLTSLALARLAARKDAKLACAPLFASALGAAILPALRLVSIPLCLIALACLWIDLRSLGAPEERSEARPSERICLAAAFLALGCAVLWDLGFAPGWTLQWERDIIHGYAGDVLAGKSALGRLTGLLIWDIGALSTAQNSLLFGGLGYPALAALGYTNFALRLPAAIFGLISCVLLFGVCRAMFGPRVAVWSSAAFALSETTIFYSRYGSSPTATLASLLLAVYLCWRCARSTGGLWWRAGLAGLALYLATLEYAPGRIVVILLLPLTLLGMLSGGAAKSAKVAGVSMLLAVTGAVLFLQWRHDALATLLDARGEQIFGMLPDTLEHRKILGIEQEPGVPFKRLAPADQARFVAKLIGTKTGPQMASLLSPLYEEDVKPLALQFDPPLIRPYFAGWTVFLIPGLLAALRRPLRWENAVWIAWGALGCLSLLLTNRVDAHRISFLSVPFAVWIGLGANWAASRLESLPRLPWGLGRLALAALILSPLPYLVEINHMREPPPTFAGEALLAAVESVPDPVAFAADWEKIEHAPWDHKQIGALELRLLERTRSVPGWSYQFLADEYVAGLEDGELARSTRYLAELMKLLRERALVAAPAEKFAALRSMLEERGIPSTLRRRPGLDVLLIPRRQAAVPSVHP